jgi:lysine 6-dehydrogenase
VEPLTEIEPIDFPEPFGRLEAFHTSGGLSTLASTFAGKVRNMDYKTIRYPGHCDLMHPLRALGFLDQSPVIIDDHEIRPRQLSAQILSDLLDGEGPDVVLVRVTVRGTKFGGRRRLEYELIDLADAENAQSAMMRGTAYPASIILQMIANGRIDRRGVLSQERVVPVEELIEELRQRGVNIVERQS